MNQGRQLEGISVHQVICLGTLDGRMLHASSVGSPASAT